MKILKNLLTLLGLVLIFPLVSCGELKDLDPITPEPEDKDDIIIIDRKKDKSDEIVDGKESTALSGQTYVAHYQNQENLAEQVEDRITFKNTTYTRIRYFYIDGKESRDPSVHQGEYFFRKDGVLILMFKEVRIIGNTKRTHRKELGFYFNEAEGEFFSDLMRFEKVEEEKK